ncbi:MAG: DEAD/DEAH box helicase [Myxococcota bacterium]
MQFKELGLAPALLKTLARLGYETPTPIQAQTIPAALDGRDILGLAQTGTGKTAAFALPVLDAYARSGRDRPRAKDPRILVLAPTRELAGQVGESFDEYGRGLGVKTAVVFGGVNQNRQVEALKRGVDVLVACPGRLLDLMSQGFVRLNAVQLLILDEADRMLDMGFIQPIRRIVKQLPRDRQNLLFSATMAKEIKALAAEILNDPVEVSIAPKVTTAPKVEQWLYHVENSAKPDLLKALLTSQRVERAVVFTRTKRGADRLAKKLGRTQVGEAAVIHGNKSQNARIRALDGFKKGTTRVLVATDVAARGIDVDGVSHVVNFDLPNEPESYVHRIGRTGRAGATGMAMSFCDPSERAYLRDIEKLTKKSIPVEREHAWASAEKLPEEEPPKPGANRGPRPPRNGQGGSRDGGQGRSGHRAGGRSGASSGRSHGHGGRPGGSGGRPASSGRGRRRRAG